MIAKRLNVGDTIAIISPSAVLTDKEDLITLTKAVALMEEKGFKIIKGDYAFSNELGYGASAIHKAEDINNMFKNQNVKAIFAITGGENSLSTFDYIDFENIKKNPKIICGFSDTTSILNEITEKTGLVTFLGPSFKSIASGETKYRLNALLDRFLYHKDNLAYKEDLSEFRVIKRGKAEGKLIGGNLCLTTDLISGKYKIDFKNKILCLEDFAFESNPGRVSHDLYKMKQEGVFNQIAGIWLGNYEGNISIEQILLDTLSDMKFEKPIIKSENFGHSEKKIVIPIGTLAEIDTNADKPYIKLKGEFNA